MTTSEFNAELPAFAPIVEKLAEEITSGRNWDMEAELMLAVECPSDCEDECCVEPKAPELDEQAAEDMFEEFVNEMFPTVSIMGLDYDPARVLREVDPTAYRQEFVNWVDSQERDGIYSFPWNE
jgi:hypothetical protein